ncbi:MAG: signal recognition particle receptor subunit alpha, partial [Myxococcota bacterium]
MLVIGGIAVVFIALIGLAVRRLARGQQPEGQPQQKLQAGSESEAESTAEAQKATSEEPALPPKAMREGLAKTRKGFMAKLNELIFKSDLDEDLVDELEGILVTSDVGIRTTERLLSELRSALSRKEISDPAVVRDRLRARVSEIVHR